MLKDALDDFGKYVVQQSRRNLTKDKKNASKKLYDSIKYDYKVNKNSFELTFLMEDYAAYINDGVVGTEQNLTKNSNLSLGSQKFRYKKGIENKPSRKHFDKWSVQKGFAPRNKKGQFQTRIGMTIAISYAVWRKGLETTNFFTQPFERAFKRLPDDIVEAYGLELDSLMETTIL
jgi:hypothetical protein